MQGTNKRRKNLGKTRGFHKLREKTWKLDQNFFQENNPTVNFDCSSPQNIQTTSGEAHDWEHNSHSPSHGICESLKTREKKLARRNKRRYLSTWRDTGSRERRRRLVNWVDYRRKLLHRFLQPENQEDHGAGNRHRRRQNHSLRGQRGSHDS